MVREDIVAGLKNAVERGYPLETAKQAFLNAGYSRQEVEEAAAYLSRGAINIQQPMQPIRPQQYPQQAQPAQQPSQQPTQYPQYQQYPQPQPTLMQQQIQKPAEKKGKGLIIFLIVLLVVLVIAAIGAFIYKTQIISFFNTLFK